VLVGVEIDADPVKADGSWVAYPDQIDYAILTLHRIPVLNVGHWQFREMNVSEQERRYLGGVWLDWFEACVERGGMQILAHPLREPINLGMLSLTDDRTMARALEVLHKAANRSVAFEINNGWCGAVRNLGEFDEYVTLMRELKARGMKFSCGSDAHGVEHVGAREGIRQLTQAAGLEAGDWFDADTLGPAADRADHGF
jgi:histidinol phosphatase-like PHP family hydrolase